MKPEAKLKRDVLRLLHRAGAKALVTTGVSEAGTPDIIVCYFGRTLAIELKAGRRKPTALQARRLIQWAAAGAKVFVIYEIEEVVMALARVASESGVYPQLVFDEEPRTGQ